jgi:RimJ/RimL family protein N-acetyltransferase
MAELARHDVVLEGDTPLGVHVRLRPLTEGDWDVLYRWNNDPQVLYYAEGDETTARSRQEVQDLYCWVCQKAFCFLIEADGVPVGECWLQEMNLHRVLRRSLYLDCRRIDLMIGEKAYWGHGIGTAAIRLLTAFGFEQCGADVIYGCDIADYNVRSRKAFQRVGYALVGEIRGEPGDKTRVCYDLALTKKAFFATHRPDPGERHCTAECPNNPIPNP